MFTSRLQNERTDVLVRALLSLNNEEEVYRVLEDLLTIREVGELSQRLEVAFMLRDKATYSEIVDFLGDNGVGISVASVCRYARAYQAEVQMLNMAQENFRRMMDELDK